MILCLINPKDCILHPTNPEKVQKYLKDLKAGANFPPIEVMEFSGQYIVKDGNHRTFAHLLQDELIWAYVFEEEDYPSRHLLGRRLGGLKK